MSRAEKAALKAYPQQDDRFYEVIRECYVEGYEQAEKDIISLIESRIKEIIGDAQPNPVLRLELQGIINKIKENGNSISTP